MTGAAMRKALREERADRRRRAELGTSAAPAVDLRTKLAREELVEAIAEAGKRWWTAARTKANHARMSRAEIDLWNAIGALKDHDGEDVR